MKPIIPDVPRTAWNSLYDAAQRVQLLRPWEILDDDDLICVRDPSTGNMGYGIFMGSLGELFGFCLYRGAPGFDMYTRLVSDAFDPEDDDYFVLPDCLKLELCARTDLAEEDLAVIKDLGLRFKGANAWPQFRSMVPLFIPWFLTENEVRFLAIALHAGCYHAERVAKGEAVSPLRDGECLVYTPLDGSQGGYSTQWEPWPILDRPKPAQPILNLARINAILAKQAISPDPWQADVSCIPSAVSDRDRPYYLRMAIVCQQSSGLVMNVEAVPPETPEGQALHNAICASIEQVGAIPQTVIVRSANQAAALASLGKVLGITIRHRKKLGAIREFKESLIMRFGRGG